MVPIEKAVLIVAHPDDEILWFSSVLGRCKRMVACFGSAADPSEGFNVGREIVSNTYPLPNARFLKVQQSDAYQTFNWRRAKSVKGSLEFRKKNSLYTRNSSLLCDLLRAEVEHEKIIFTHNPWGEYGNEEHVQVFDVLNKLRLELGFEMFVSSYVSNRSHRLMSKTLHLVSHPSGRGDGVAYGVDLELAASIKALYSKNHCWTWMPDYEWPVMEMFYRVTDQMGRPQVSCSSTVPLNYVNFQFAFSHTERLASRVLPTRVKKMVRALRLA